MKTIFFKNANGDVFGLDVHGEHDENYKGYIQKDWVEISKDDAISMANPPNTTEPIPHTITMRQARLMLHRNGLLNGVQSAINSLEEPQKTEAQIEWDYAQTVNRDNPIMQLLADSLGLSDEALDEMFLEASKL